MSFSLLLALFLVDFFCLVAAFTFDILTGALALLAAAVVGDLR
jgi:hypothetical protein